MHFRRSPALLACVVLAVGLVGGLACSDDSDRGGGSVTTYHEGDSIEVENGQQFVIALESNPSTGYTWDAGDNPNVKYVTSKQVPSTAGIPGASGIQELTFKAVKKGTSTLELAYARQFEGGVPPAATTSFDVTVS